MTLLRFLWFCYRAYRKSAAAPAGVHAPLGVHYFGMVPVYYAGAPQLAVIIGIGRDAWVVTQLALEHQLTAVGFGKAK
jgi:hypothetical protein